MTPDEARATFEMNWSHIIRRQARALKEQGYRMDVQVSTASGFTEDVFAAWFLRAAEELQKAISAWEQAEVRAARLREALRTITAVVVHYDEPPGEWGHICPEVALSALRASTTEEAEA